MKFISFGSGSSGNCYYLLEDGIGLIIDAGIGIRSFKKYFREYGFTYPTLKAILVTHDHTDHVKAVGALSGEYNLEVFATEEVHKGILNNYYAHKKVRPELCRTYLPGDDWSIGPFHITTFTVPHDASHNCGYFIETATTNFCFITDAGSFTPEMISFIRRARNLVIEANYDAAMLDEGPYPLHLKKRIKAPTGHACNAETARILEENLAATTENIWLCHLSEENNHPELARKTIAQALERWTASRNFTFYAAAFPPAHLNYNVTRYCRLYYRRRRLYILYPRTVSPFSRFRKRRQQVRILHSRMPT